MIQGKWAMSNNKGIVLTSDLAEKNAAARKLFWPSISDDWLNSDFFFSPLHKKHIECSHCTSLAVPGQNLTCEMLTPKTDVFSVSLCFKRVSVLSVLQFDRIHFYPFCKSWVLLFLMHKGDYYYYYFFYHFKARLTAYAGFCLTQVADLVVIHSVTLGEKNFTPYICHSSLFLKSWMSMRVMSRDIDPRPGVDRRCCLTAAAHNWSLFPPFQG